MHFRTAGTGDLAIVCVHGLAQSGYLWESTLNALPLGWSAYAVDLVGFGASAQPETGYTIDFHAECLREFILGIPQRTVILAANSLGGVIAMKLAADHPNLISGLVLVATGARVRDPVALASSRERWKTLALNEENCRAIARRYTFQTLKDEVLQRIASEVAKASRAAVLETMASSLATDLTASLPLITAPTLVIQGIEDLGRPPADGIVISAGVLDGRMIALPRVGHTPMLDAPEEFQRWLHSFLETWTPSINNSPE